MYRIEAAAFQINLIFTQKIAHGFWMLRDTTTNLVVSSLHGLATSRKTGMILPIGYTKDHSLRAYHAVYDDLFARKNAFKRGGPLLESHRSHIVYAGDDALERWQRAVSAVDLINELDINYPRFGVKILGFYPAINSNSIYHTFADCMDIPAYQFEGLWYLGIRHSLYGLIKHDKKFQNRKM